MAMDIAGRSLRVTRSLRFRLTVSYVVFFSLLLIAIGLVFRPGMKSIMEARAEAVLDEEWGSAHGYLQFENYGPDWFYDAFDPEEALIVARLQHVYLLADADGKPRQSSEIYKSIGVDSPQEIQKVLQSGLPVLRIRSDSEGVPYLVRSGRLVDDKRKKVYFLSIGRSLADDRRLLDNLQREYLVILPIAIAICSIFGWFVAGRALMPLNSVSQAAQHITGQKLDVRIPSRGAGDELDRLIGAFNRMMGRLNRSFEQIRRFSTDVSHELRTPLTVIRGQLEVALITAKTVEQHRDAMVSALEDVERLSNIVRALLLLSQSETGQLVLHKVDLDLAEVVRDIVDQYQIPAQERGIELSAGAPDQCVIQADRTQIERLFSNLLSNAVKYTSVGGTVHVQLDSEPTQARLVFVDNGVGIAPEHLPRIFERFYKVPSSDPEKGLGLGLSFVAWIVKAHGGTISVDSAPMRGSRFTVLLPHETVAPAPPTPAANASEQLR